MRERLVDAVARTLHPDGLVSLGGRLDATAVLTALARALREDEEAVEAMQDPFRIGDARGKLAKLCDYLCAGGSKRPKKTGTINLTERGAPVAFICNGRCRKLQMEAHMDLDPVQYNTLVSPRRAREITTLSPREQDRREQAGTFPKSIRLGHGHNGRKAYRLGELIDWCKARVAERDETAA